MDPTIGDGIDITPSWETIVNMAERFTIDSANAEAAAVLFAELRRLAQIADDKNPDLIITTREETP